MESLSQREGFEFSFSPTGTLKPALRIEGDRELERYVRLLERTCHGANLSYLSKEQVENELHSPLLDAALYYRRGGQFNPSSWSAALQPLPSGTA